MCRRSALFISSNDKPSIARSAKNSITKKHSSQFRVISFPGEEEWMKISSRERSRDQRWNDHSGVDPTDPDPVTPVFFQKLVRGSRAPTTWSIAI
jgi:hypothetical protein